MDHWWFVAEVLMLCVSIMYYTLLILSCNRPCFLLIMTGFDFWVKVYYALMLAVANSLYIRRNNAVRNYEIIMDLIGIVFLLMVVVASLMEGYGRSWKASFGFGL